MFPKSGYALEEGAGHGIWFANTLMTVKASGEETSGAYAVVDCLLPSGFAPPPHCHRREIETWYILAGELRVTCGDEHWTVGPGAFVCLPRGIPHGFVVSSATPARVLQISAPAQFERFIAEAGEPATERVLPPPRPPDIAKMEALMQKYEIEGVPPL